MKKYLLIASLWLLAEQAYAQKIHITDTTNYWYITGIDSNGNVFWSYYDYLYGPMSFGGHDYRNLESFSNAVTPYTGGAILIREDTMTGIVYIYNNTPTPFETILYNYNLHLGDTVHYSYYRMGIPSPYIDTSIVDSVIGIDSMLINGLYYKVFSLAEIDTSHIHVRGWNPLLTYIEGIGSVFDPMNAQYMAMYDNDTVLLKCFINKGIPPVINIPFTFPVAGHIDTFINNCAFLGAPPLSGATGRNSMQVQPNPIDEDAQIVFSQSIALGRLVVCNSIGQVVMNTVFQHKDAMTIGNKIKLPGIYFYEVMDNESGAVYRGKFVKE